MLDSQYGYNLGFLFHWGQWHSPWLPHECFPSGAGQNPVQSWRHPWPFQEQAQSFLPPSTMWWWGVSGSQSHASSKSVSVVTDQVPRLVMVRGMTCLAALPALRQTHTNSVSPHPFWATSCMSLLPSPFSPELPPFQQWECSGPSYSPYCPGLSNVISFLLNPETPYSNWATFPIQCQFLCLSAKTFLILPHIQCYLLPSDGTWSKVESLLRTHLSSVKQLATDPWSLR